MLLPHPSHRRSLAHLLDALAAGEAIARDCAARQADLCTDPVLRRYFRTQSRQEAMHALVFAGATRLIAPRGTARNPLRPLLAAYASALEADLRAGRLPETLVGMQVVLEEVGGAVLVELDRAIRQQGDQHAGLRRTLLAQEQAHRSFGARALRRMSAAHQTDTATLQAAAHRYLGLGTGLLEASGDLFRDLEIDQAAFLDALPRTVLAAIGTQAG